ncbi:unnamed protein product [Spirodela intermedia]|uniref:Uncharacterized protein n=1 Tax=Spirodela intermedia TaxID=51605 RepID=A0A7I8JXD7_SPIIN|nr:unnamed protein product [Spirodela intermedia]
MIGGRGRGGGTAPWCFVGRDRPPETEKVVDQRRQDRGESHNDIATTSARPVLGLPFFLAVLQNWVQSRSAQRYPSSTK